MATHLALHLRMAPVLLMLIQDDALDVAPLELRDVRVQPPLGGLAECVEKGRRGLLPPGIEALRPRQPGEGVIDRDGVEVPRVVAEPVSGATG